ncbi:HAD family hydrolase [Streptomyces sp. NRRL S-244]|uniref:HAD family hydrolase n=1 Tax=Streptomyces sp. NRRL S-244 TaxID=1463897 RepID=UPI001F283355|nr:HAD hydrolase-like protein [Streptomyces sp. NRRL S-244]
MPAIWQRPRISFTSFAGRCLDRYVSLSVGLLLALNTQGVSPEKVVLIGDSVTDVQAALAAGAMSIGYANKPARPSGRGGQA